MLGVERAVTRWYARRQTIQQEITTLQARFEQLQPENQGLPSAELSEVERQLAEVQARLHNLGPCPRPMMG